MTEELDKLEAEIKATQAAYEAGDIIFKETHKAARAYLAAQRQAGDTEMPDVNEAVYGYLDKKALKANERERDLLAGLYFYLQECGYISAQRQATANSVPVSVVSKALDILKEPAGWFAGGEGAGYDFQDEIIKAINELEPWVKGVE